MFLSPETIDILMSMDAPADQKAALLKSMQRDALVPAVAEMEATGLATFVRRKPAVDGVRVYVMEDASGRVKVGISQNPYWRRKQLAYELKTEITLYYATAGMTRAEALSIEARAHSDLGEHRLVGEWFSCDLGDAVDAIQQAKTGVQ